MDFPRPSQTGEETVVLYPSFATMGDQQGQWKAHVAGSVTRVNPSRWQRRVFTRLMQRMMKVPAHELDGELFRQRMQQFLALACRGRRVLLELEQQQLPLRRPSQRNGHFREVLPLQGETFSQVRLPQPLNQRHVRVRVRQVTGEPLSAEGTIELIPPEGLSVISDIDDTIKQSEVLHRRDLLRNTFLRPFETVPGMVQLYRRWSQAGASFHYVSSSPWQLYDCLAEMMYRERFPYGSIHLRQLRLRDSGLFRWMVLRRRPKALMIRWLLNEFPRRRFILVGDSGESDPEIYADLARANTGQVARILIRELPQRGMTADRCRRVFRGLPKDIWQVFRDPEEIGA